MTYVIGYIIHGLIFGLISRYVSKSRGHEGGFAWGFWLGLIGLLVVGLRGDRDPGVNKPKGDGIRLKEYPNRKGEQARNE